ncbi:hypothetical protein BC830DRAFT_622532 [Chytriomyces sp. MP71]|nr:hypothetical protein BC830DRAFT_622532 [Chytriomyces sp. MP71]
MTPNPFTVTTTTPVPTALHKMVECRCRHLPVLVAHSAVEPDIFSDSGVEVAGLLDITQCVFARLNSLDAKALSRMVITVGGVLRDPHNPRTPITGPSATIAEACAIMRDAQHTSVLVVDESGDSLIGILTNKDILIRVLAKGLDPNEETVLGVMTPLPEFVIPSTSVLEALLMMRGSLVLIGHVQVTQYGISQKLIETLCPVFTEGGYLHLPVLENGKPVGLVDVLTLAMSILDHILKLDQSEIQDTIESITSEGPLWNRFWNSSDLRSETLPDASPPAPAGLAEQADENTDTLDDDDTGSITSAGAFYRRQRAHQLELETTGRETPPRTGDQFVFKVHDLEQDAIHRFPAPCASLEDFLNALSGKLGRPISRAWIAGVGNVMGQEDLEAAVSGARARGDVRILVKVGGKDAGKRNRQSVDTAGSTGLGWMRLNVGGVRFETAGPTLVSVRRECICSSIS